MKLKIYNGTPSDEPICLRCAHLRIVKGTRQSDEIRDCVKLARAVPFPVSSCGYFQEREKDVSRYRNAMYLRYDPNSRRLMIETGMFMPDLTVDEYRKRIEGAEPAPEASVIQ